MEYSFNDNLNDLMLNKNLTITDLANAVNLPYKTVSNYVNGKYVPNLQNAIKLANYFDCSIDYLVGISNNADTKKYSKLDFLFYERYIQLLKESKITHYRLTKDLGLNINIWRKWKNGAIPTLSVLTKIAQYFGVSIDFLIGRN